MILLNPSKHNYMLSRISRLSTSTINQLLYNIGSKNEVEWYLNHFSSADQFAVIKVGGGVLEQNLDELSTALVFLQNVGLYPIVVHGSGPQMNLELDRLNIKKHYENGIRVTDLDTLKVAKRLFVKQNIKLCNAIEKLGTRTRPFYCGIFEATYLDKTKYGYVGNITNVNKQLLKSAIHHGALPILTSLAETETGQTLNINADVAAVELAKALKPLKIVFINESGGMFDNHNNKINVINMDQEYLHYMQLDWVKYGTRLKLEQFNNLLLQLPRSSSISITKANQLQRELFTHRGAGTLIRRGFKINKHTMSTVDLALLKSKLSNYYLFKKITPECFFGLLNNCSIYCDEQLDCIAIVLLMDDIPTMVTFHSNNNARLHDVDELIMDRVLSDYPSLMWVINIDDPNKLWHFKQAQGTLKCEDDIVCWIDNDLQHVTQQYKKYKQYFKRQHHTLARRGHSSSPKFSVGIVGARGHVGNELLKLLDNHSCCEVSVVGSRSVGIVEQYTRSRVEYTHVKPSNINDYNVDVWILALPNGHAQPYVDALNTNNGSERPRIIDLSADYRFNKEWTYGLPELNRSKIRSSRLISNPGCYATACQLGIAPLITRLKSCNIFGVSGYSGAGHINDKVIHGIEEDNIQAYKLQQHIHEREVKEHTREVTFTPHIASHYRGILATLQIRLNDNSNNKQLLDIYRDYYKNEGLIKIKEEIPRLRDIMNKDHVEIGGFSAHGNSGVIVCTLDNLLKGAATQCIQNLNLIMGVPEYTGILDK